MCIMWNLVLMWNCGVVYFGFQVEFVYFILKSGKFCKNVKYFYWYIYVLIFQNICIDYLENKNMKIGILYVLINFKSIFCFIE